MLRRQRLAVDLVGEQHVVAQCLVEREAPLVVLLDAAFEPVVDPGEHHLDGVVVEARLLEQGAERDAAPAGGPDGLEQPRLAEGSWRQPRPSVPGALHRDDDLGSRSGPEVVEPERERRPHAAIDGETPRPRVDRGHVVVDEEVVEADRRQVVPERLERHPVVPRGELELLESDAVRLPGRRRHRCLVHATQGSHGDGGRC